MVGRWWGSVLCTRGEEVVVPPVPRVNWVRITRKFWGVGARALLAPRAGEKFRGGFLKTGWDNFSEGGLKCWWSR